MRQNFTEKIGSLALLHPKYFAVFESYKAKIKYFANRSVNSLKCLKSIRVYRGEI